ncbi:MAG TPA: serine/threonine-protein kinase [Polyangiaceae bacterium]|nr:serine/threonine-protein kinase [Polyangiaceae bacterium]
MGTAPNIHQIDGKYRLLAQLGQGGTADVSLAVARGPSGFNKLVVLKSMRSTMRAEPELARMFLNEARLAARLNHPNIVQTNEVFEFDGLPVIVMEYLEGQPLSSVLSRGRAAGTFTLAMHLRVISEALSGLHYSHELKDFDGTALNVVHRDMSPHNVFLTFDGQIKVLDFGIAKLSASLVETATGVIKGKLHYMPPEQIAGEGIDRRSDIYAMGVMLWEAATGQRMWKNRHDAAVMNAILNGEVPKARDICTIDPELERIIDKALSFDQRQRYQTAYDLQNDLDAFVSTLGGGTLRDIGKVVAELFADTRAETQRLIEVQLSKVASLSAVEWAATHPSELTASTTTHLGYEAGSHSGVTVQPVKKTRSNRWLLVAAGLLLVGGGALFLRSQKATADAARRASAAAAPVAEAPGTVRVLITAFPAHARVFIDGELTPSNPFSRHFPQDGSTKHKVVVEAPDHRSETREVVFAADSDLVITLEPVAPAKAPTPPATTASEPKSVSRGTRRPVADPGEAPRADCELPYFVDARGVKKYKPQCLR